MTKSVRFSGVLLTAVMIVCIYFSGIAPLMANECQVNYKKQTLCLDCSDEEISGVSYATGDCQATCKDWGQSALPESDKFYQSYRYTAFDSGFRRCEVSSNASKYEDNCPPVDAGISECNY